MRGLLKTINLFLEETDKDIVILDKTKRLFHLDLFMQISMQEGKFDIHLMDLPFIGWNKGKNKVNEVHFGNRGKCFSIFSALNLWKTFSNEYAFVFINFTISSILFSINPLAFDKFYDFKKRYKIPCVIC